MQSDLAGAKSELSAAIARVTEAERAFGLEGSSTAWKAVAASKEASEKAATRLRVLESIAEEERKAAEAKAGTERVAALRAELEAAEAVEKSSALDAHDRDLFTAGIASIARALANVEQRRARRLGANEQANDLRQALGLRSVTPDHLMRCDAAAILSTSFAEGIRAGSFESVAAAKAACLSAARSADMYKAGVDDDNRRHNERYQRLRVLQENMARNDALVIKRAKVRGELAATMGKVSDRMKRVGDCIVQVQDAERAIAHHDEIDRQLAATMRAEGEEIARLTDIASRGSK